MNRDQALSKIKKCLALGKSANPHEAAAAMRQAQKLMQEHGLTEHDVALADVSEVQAPTAMKSVLWEVQLADMIANAFGCEVIWLNVHAWLPSGRRKHSHLVAFIGVGAAPTVAGYAWEVLDRQCARQRLEHVRRQPKNCKPITRTARGDVFASGWVRGVADKLRAFAGERHQLLLDQFIAQHHPATTDVSVGFRAKGRNVSTNDMRAGFIAGQAARLDHALNKGSEQLQIGAAS